MKWCLMSQRQVKRLKQNVSLAVFRLFSQLMMQIITTTYVIMFSGTRFTMTNRRQEARPPLLVSTRPTPRRRVTAGCTESPWRVTSPSPQLRRTRMSGSWRVWYKDRRGRRDLTGGWEKRRISSRLRQSPTTGMIIGMMRSIHCNVLAI